MFTRKCKPEDFKILPKKVNKRAFIKQVISHFRSNQQNVQNSRGTKPTLICTLAGKQATW